MYLLLRSFRRRQNGCKRERRCRMTECARRDHENLNPRSLTDGNCSYIGKACWFLGCLELIVQSRGEHVRKDNKLEHGRVVLCLTEEQFKYRFLAQTVDNTRRCE